MTATTRETDPQRQEIRILARRVWVAWYSGQHERARGFAAKLNALLLEMSGFERDESEAETLTEVSFVRVKVAGHAPVCVTPWVGEGLRDGETRGGL